MSSAPLPPCDYCQRHGFDHRIPGSKPLSAYLGPERDSDGQPTTIHVMYSAGEHVGHGEAELVRRRVNVDPGDLYVVDDCLGNGPAVCWRYPGTAEDQPFDYPVLYRHTLDSPPFDTDDHAALLWFVITSMIPAKEPTDG